MGVCCNKEINNRKPGNSQLISVSTLSRSVKLENIHKKYRFTRVIGYGVFGTVREAIKTTTITSTPCKSFAIKSIIKSKVERKLELLRRELNILMKVDHPNIIKLFEVYEDKKYLHIVTELCTGGDLLDYLLKKGNLSESEAVLLLYKALSAISYLHNINICHRDIKPENFLLLSASNEALKLVDFGMSNFMTSDELSTFAGTPYYIAPEIIQGNYGKECDVWSLGVVAYFLLSGRQPFHSNSVTQVFSNILEGNYSFNYPIWDSISELTKDLIEKILVVSPSTRITISEALKHPVFTQKKEDSIQLQVFKSIKKFKAPNKLWQEAMTIFVKYCNVEEINLLSQAFSEIDQAKTGWITPNDILAAMLKNNCTLAYEEFSQLVKNFEYIGKGKLNYSQFLVAAMDRKHQINEEQLWMLFNHFDLDNNGKISLEELRNVIEKSGFNLEENDIEEILDEFQEKAPNSMDFETFWNFMRNFTEEASEKSPARVKRKMKHHYTVSIRQAEKEQIFIANSIN